MLLLTSGNLKEGRVGGYYAWVKRNKKRATRPSPTPSQGFLDDFPSSSCRFFLLFLPITMTVVTTAAMTARMSK